MAQEELAILEGQLSSCRASIAKIEAAGQSYSIEGNAWARAELRTLYERERDLLGRIAQATAGGMRVRLGRPLG